MPHSQASRITVEASAIEVHFSRSCLNLKATASSMVSPSNTASTMAISASGVHCSAQVSAQVVPSCRTASFLPKPTSSTARRCKKLERCRSRNAASEDLTRLKLDQFKTADHGRVTLTEQSHGG